jgi:uncharacterized protein YggE
MSRLPALMLVVWGMSAAAQDSPRAPVSQIVTSAEAVARVRPDRASIDVGVQTRAATAAEAAALNARRQQAIIDAVRARGVASDDIATTNYNVSPELRYREGEAPQVTGFTVSNEVLVTVRTIGAVGGVIDAALAAGANQINSLEFSVANPDSARRAALTAAVVKARADAEVMARAAGGALGQLLELASTEQGVPVPRPVMAMSRASVGDEAATPIQSGQQEIRASVSARWQFVPSP